MPRLFEMQAEVTSLDQQMAGLPHDFFKSLQPDYSEFLILCQKSKCISYLAGIMN